MKNVLILSGSPRKNGNSDTLCNEFLRGAVDAGNDVEKIFLDEKNIGFCKGCMYCRTHDGKCVIDDDAAEILDKFEAADVIVLASPVYFYSIVAQMKTFIDRMSARWTRTKNKEFYYILTAAETTDTVMDCSLECFRGLQVCLKGSVEKGVILGKGLSKPTDAKNSAFMQVAYDMGKNV
ncbi:MAG: flavodoxin family protein [Anaerofustis stercorihominis]|nr:flavodoxin family protein [Anaerofustis stercorihominis]